MSRGPVRGAIRRWITVRWRPRIWLAVAVVFGFVLGFFPLVNVLGFELALVTSFLASIAGLDIGRAFAREMQVDRRTGEAAPIIVEERRAPGLDRATWPGRMLARSTLAAAGLAIAFVLVPLPICIVRGLWVPTCDWGFGFEAYFALPVITAALAGALGHAIGVLVGQRRYLGGVLSVVAWFALAIAAFWRFYSEPPVFTYNAILGYFPGNLYDENVAIHGALWWSRLEQLAWIAGLVALLATRIDVPLHRLRRAPRPAGRRWRPLVVGLAALGLAVALHVSSGTLGYAVDDSDLEAALGGRIETEHFVIYHSQRPDVVADIELVARDHEFRYSQIVAQTGTAPPGKIRSFYFADRAEKARLFGAKDVEMAKPWLGDIYLDHRAFPHGSLRHEIAHAVAGSFGDPVFGVAAKRVFGIPAMFSPGLIEGLAVALDWPGGYERPTPHESVRAMQAKGLAPSIDQLFGLGFFAFSSQRGYTTAGSFMRFLLERHGAAQVRQLYQSGGDFEGVFGMSRGELQREWHEYLATVEIPPTLADALAERFRGVSIIARPCPHAIAKRREQAARANAEGDRVRAVDLSRQVCDDAPDEPTYRLQLAEYLHGGSAAELAEAERIWTAIANDAEGMTSSVRVVAMRNLAKLAGWRNDFARVKQLIDAAMKLPLEGSERRQIENAAFALAHTGPAAKQLVAYAFPPKDGVDALALTEEIVKLEPTLGIGHYLLGLQRGLRRDWAGAATALSKALELGVPGISFVRNGARLLAIAAYRANDAGGLQHAISVLNGAGMETGDKLLAKDWAERVAFDQRAR